MWRAHASLRLARWPLLASTCVLMSVTTLHAQSEPASPAQHELSDKSQELEDLRYRIKASRRKAATLEADERQQMARLAELDREKALTEKLLGELEGHSAELETRRAELEVEIETLRGRLRRREASLARRLREMYMRPTSSLVAMALGNADMSRFGARARALRHIAATERSLIDAVLADQAALLSRQHEVDGAAAVIGLHQSEALEQRDQLVHLSEERGRALGEIRRQHRSARDTAAELERAAQALEDLISRLEEQRQQEPSQLYTGFAALKGTLPWPVLGEVVQRFGPATRPQLAEPIVSKGWKIRAPHGTPILAPAAGTVDFVDWLPGYGQCIIVNHGDGYYSLYAHASSVFPRVGAQVAASEVIAEVGDTGSVEGSLLYLEIRQGRTPLDPAQWLRSAP